MLFLTQFAGRTIGSTALVAVLKKLCMARIATVAPILQSAPVRGKKAPIFALRPAARPWSFDIEAARRGNGKRG